MKTLLCFAIALLAGFGTQAQSRVVQSPPVRDYTTPDLLRQQIGAAERYLTEYKQASNVVALETAIRATRERLPTEYYRRFPADRDNLLRQRLRIARCLGELCRRPDIVDLSRLPLANVPVPLKADKITGHYYMSGVDPKAIVDPELRAEYEVALRENERRKELRAYEHKLDTIRARADSSVAAYLRDAYSGVADRSSLHRILDEEAPDVRRRRVIYESAEVPLPAKDRPAGEDSALHPSATTNSAPVAP